MRVLKEKIKVKDAKMKTKEEVDCVLNRQKYLDILS